MVCCKKLDKIDKIIISLTFIIVTILCIYNTISYASENVEYLKKNDIVISPNSNTFGENDSAFIGYFPLEKGYTYRITTTGSVGRYFAKSDEIPVIGGTYEYLGYINNQQEFVYNSVSEDEFMYFSFYYGDNVTITKEVTYGFKNVINELISQVGYTNIWKVFENSVPYVFVVVLFSLGVWFIKHNIIEHSKGRDY